MTCGGGISFKPGSTFQALATLTIMQDGAEVADLTGWTFRCQLRRFGGQLVSELDCELVDALAHKLRLEADDTTDWPTNSALIGDIEATDPSGDVVLIGGTFQIATGARVTQ